jgi:molecular chaperone GrpE
MAEIAQRIGELTELFRRRLLNDARGNEVVAELRNRSALDETLLVGRVLRPIAMRLVSVVDRVDNWDGDPDPLAASARDEILQILEDFGIDEVDTDQGFDPRIHRVQAKVPSPEPPGTIVGCHTRGFQLDDRVLRPAGVVVADVPEGVPVPTDGP